MSDKESIDIFDKIWLADIINKKEPLYSIAISVAEHWSPHPGSGFSVQPSLKQILVEKIKAKWRQELINEIVKNKSNDYGPLNNVQDIIECFRIKYKHSSIILDLLNGISRAELFVFDSKDQGSHSCNSK